MAAVTIIKKYCFLAGALILALFCGCSSFDEHRIGAVSPVAVPLSPAECVAGTWDKTLCKPGFYAGYSNVDRQSLWVSYQLDASQLQGPKHKRSNRFYPDMSVKDPVYPADYTRSGYDRGHLAPAANMAYCSEAVDASFCMTNISPQAPGCNRGIWKILESEVRRWAAKEKSILVIIGPVFPAKGYMGKSSIPVPRAFYKIIYDLTPPEKSLPLSSPMNQAARIFLPLQSV